MEPEDRRYHPLPNTRTDLGYIWQPTDVEHAVHMLREFLERVDAKAFYQDVYATNNRVYRNILVQLPGIPAFPIAEDIHILFDRDGGRHLNLRLEY